MSDTESKMREELARSRAVEVLGSDPVRFENPLTVLASPAWRGIEGDIWRASSNEQSIIIKHYHPDTSFYVEPGSAIEAARQAGSLDVGPKVLRECVGDGIVAFENLSAPWRAGGLHDGVSSILRAKVIELKKTFQLGAKLQKNVSIFDEIEALHAICASSGLPTHADIAVFASFFRDAKAKIWSLGRDLVPCHRDGNTANIMVAPDHQVKLIDFDLAANCDPFEDIGCHLVEYYEAEPEARAGFEEWYGQFNEGLFQRSMLYGLADDMRWGLIGAIMAARSPRRALEFSKYSAWRFIRLEMHAKNSHANDRIRVAA
ncbi:MAG: phosphotransferase [Rhizobiaceae bacterium]|nr:phosphotransferase [Rhizobiaceae bacterium]|tara:strand:+ start:128393 stop:129343 length:951 start_codon:yes stop_codon:yes gene_type:complete